MRDSSTERESAGSLAGWLVSQGILRGPLPFTDYWSSVFRLAGGDRPERTDAGLVDRALFRLGIDRPELELPRLRYYLLLFFGGPVLVAFRSFRRLGRYKIRTRSGMGERVAESLAEFHLELRPAASGRVDAHRPARAGGDLMAAGLVDPLRISGFTSLFLAAYKLPLAALAGIAFVGIALPALHGSGLLEHYGVRVLVIGFVPLVLFLYAVFRDTFAAVLGAVPVLVATLLYWSLSPVTSRDWSAFALWLGVLFVVYLVVDLFFFPRPVPPTLLLYTREGDGTPYARTGDAPWWLEGEAYWVWRYLMLTPAEVNKFWEKDWERVDLWIRADGPDAGLLEWVVTDGHYRELWTPWERLAPAERLSRLRTDARRAMETGGSGTWLVEVDANIIFHTPDLRAVSFLPEEGRVPARSIGHVLRSLWTRVHDPDPLAAMRRLESVGLDRGRNLLADLPELIANRAARHILSLPWTHWRYPLGANRRREMLVYEEWTRPEPLPAADPSLQIKLESGGPLDLS